MRDDSSNKKPFGGYGQKSIFNRFCVFVGLFPFFLSLLLALTSHKPLLLLLPIYGFLPIGENSSQAINAADIVLACMAGVACVAFAIYGYFVKPFGVIFAAVIWLSVILLLLRANQALSDLH